ncbi:MAG: thiamine biosynthesis protein ThiI [Planctomycetota bacterium]|jgi:thiamine biosynthesis protein ThiI
MLNEQDAPIEPVPAEPLAALAGPEMILIRYGEIALKGSNRGLFERRLVRNLKHAAKPVSAVKALRTHGRITLEPERRGLAVARRVADVFGVKSVSPGWGCEPTPKAVLNMAKRVMAAEMAGRGPQQITFRVKSRRADKRFPLISTDLDRAVADAVLPDYSNIKVQLVGADLELGIEVREKRAYVFVQRLPGPGGLPVGTLGKALSLLSGGIDSPVASWLGMKRGLEVSYCSFHSAPYLGEGSKKKVADLARALARWQTRSRLFVVPFTETQVAIRDNCPSPYRTVLYRRMMNRIATRIAIRYRMGALITGESLGQVASQTMENMTCIGAATELPLIRPLVCYDKEEAIAIARKLGTFEISNRPEPDCCTVFQPEHPMIRGRIDECMAAEAEIDVEGLIHRAISGLELTKIEEEA